MRRISTDGIVEGRVVAPDGSGIPRAQVSIDARADDGSCSTSVTGPDGHYRLEHVDPGVYTVRVVTSRNGIHDGRVCVRASAVTRVDFVMGD
jgi:hypothetical protein